MKIATIPSASIIKELHEPETYDPAHLLDALIEKLGLKNDAALSRILSVTQTAISKIRHRQSPVGAAMLIRMHEESELTIAELRSLLGDRRKKFRIGTVYNKPKEN
ncbi:hypothetical protein [Glaciimonas soli]|uniref:XRE family transcriptional regulator n=1 Tax=Glaciimonas soli TaxID=2590999 RepID=A0A843YZK6_9BURK|nr:hypothetical protein [Glaciimonas soli]MQR02741.1 hypothetical protein [Glaciimonas soli]